MRGRLSICMVGAMGIVFAMHNVALAKSSLDGQTFIGEVGKQGQPKGDKDTFVFKDGKFRSTACDPYGFKEASYQTALVGEVTIFSATAVSPKEGQMMWRGSLKGDQLEGTATWVKPGKPVVENWFKGKLKK